MYATTARDHSQAAASSHLSGTWTPNEDEQESASDYPPDARNLHAPCDYYYIHYTDSSLVLG